MNDTDFAALLNIPDIKVTKTVIDSNGKFLIHKVIKRRCYGILNVENLFRRIHLDLAGYGLFLQ